MSNRSLWLHGLFAAALSFAGCGGPDTPSGAPAKLWVATNGDEQHLKLSPIEPNPY
jgi:hypothetical protein